MSLTAYAELVSWKPPQASLDQAIDIDSAFDSVPVQATLSELTESGDSNPGVVEFTRNVPLWIMRGAPVGLRFPNESNPILDAGYSCWAIIAEPMQDEDTALVKDCTFVAAAWPYSRGWLATSPFKRHWNDSQEALQQKAEKKVHNFSRWRDFIRELPENPFSTQKKLPKAVLLDPNRLDEAIVPGTNFSLPRPITSGKTIQKSLIPSTCYGLCRNLDACKASLLADPWVLELSGAVDEGKLFKDFFKYHPVLGLEKVARSEKTATVLSPVQSRAKEVMDQAILLSLAGPESLAKFTATNEHHGHPPKRVATLVGHIFLDLMWNLQRRVWDELNSPKSDAEFSQRSVQPKTQDSPAASAESLAKLAITKAAEQLKHQPHAELDSLVRRLLHDFNHPAEVTWEVAEGVPLADSAPDEAAEVYEKLWECCVLTAALFRLGIRDAELAACVRELARDTSPEMKKLGEFFLLFVK